MGSDNSDGRGLHPRAGQSSKQTGTPADGAKASTPTRPAGSPVLHTPAGSPIQHFPPAQSPAAHTQAMSRSLAAATVGTVRSLADAIAQAGRDRFGIRTIHAAPAPTGQTRPAASTNANKGEVAAQTAAALLRQAVVAYAPTGTIASTVPEADAHTQQQVVGTPPGVSHH